MSRVRSSLAGSSWWMDHDHVEQELLCAYVQLALMPNSANDCRKVVVAQTEALEVSLTEIACLERPADVPPFWVEIYSRADRSVIDSCGCFEFDDEELARAVELIIEAEKSQSSVNGRSLS